MFCKLLLFVTGGGFLKGLQFSSFCIRVASECEDFIC